MEENLKLLIDRQEICDLLNRYCSSLDDRDWARLATCFTPDAIGLYGEEAGRKDGYPAIEQLCRTALEPLDSSQHLTGNHEIVISGDKAYARCYLQAQHTRAGTPGGDNLTLGGTYRDEIVRTPEGWRIRRRELHILWQAGNPDVLVL